MRTQKNRADYYLGTLVGQIIFLRYLPTLNVDSLQSPTVIDVSEDEKKEVDRLHHSMNQTYYGYDITPEAAEFGVKKSTEIAHKNWIGEINKLAEKYLPQKLHCRFERIEISNIKDFKDGLIDYLWDTDLSWYMPEDDFWVEVGKHSWFSEVILTRKIES
jgi:hypothetical protein